MSYFVFCCFKWKSEIDFFSTINTEWCHFEKCIAAVCWRVREVCVCDGEFGERYAGVTWPSTTNDTVHKSSVATRARRWSGRKDKGELVTTRRTESQETNRLLALQWITNSGLSQRIIWVSGEHKVTAQSWWPRWRPPCTMTTATRMSTWCRKTSGTGTCCWTQHGSNSRGK